MEQDIDILEELLNAKITFTISTTDYGWKALEHLIKAYKELEEKNKKKSIEIICYQEELENSIPVSLVEEKIEEINKLITEAQKESGSASKEYTIYVYQKDILQKLLEKRK